ncbi:hypothetical protein [Rhodoferax lacus]|uniref:hypothetical protein n=1 Tax=Rhodoferax lacus TaxID=2184758 RepID=UPI0011C18FDD|nr:hypothetical protein [Rhodoferax lacus]
MSKLILTHLFDLNIPFRVMFGFVRNRGFVELHSPLQRTEFRSIRPDKRTILRPAIWHIACIELGSTADSAHQRAVALDITRICGDGVGGLINRDLNNGQELVVLYKVRISSAVLADGISQGISLPSLPVRH